MAYKQQVLLSVWRLESPGSRDWKILYLMRACSSWNPPSFCILMSKKGQGHLLGPFIKDINPFLGTLPPWGYHFSQFYFLPNSIIMQARISLLNLGVIGANNQTIAGVFIISWSLRFSSILGHLVWYVSYLHIPTNVLQVYIKTVLSTMLDVSICFIGVDLRANMPHIFYSLWATGKNMKTSHTENLSDSWNV